MECCPGHSFFGAALSASSPDFVFVPEDIPCSPGQQRADLVADNHCSISGVDRPWLHTSSHTCFCGAVWPSQSSSSLLIAVYGAVLEAFPADRASILICTPRFLHQLSLFVFLALLGGIDSATSSLLEEEACGLLCAFSGVPRVPSLSAGSLRHNGHL